MNPRRTVVKDNCEQSTPPDLLTGQCRKTPSRSWTVRRTRILRGFVILWLLEAGESFMAGMRSFFDVDERLKRLTGLTAEQTAEKALRHFISLIAREKAST